MANGNGRQMVRAAPRQMTAAPMSAPAVGTRSGMWQWDGTQWVCQPCDSTGNPVPCPPVPTQSCPPWLDPQTAPWYPGANAGVSFSAAAPTFPIRGNFWWDGLMLHMFDGAAWVNIGPGAAATVPGGGNGGTVTGTGSVIISTTPPGNPALGAEWWNGSQLHVWDGNEWQIVGPGALTGPVPSTQIAFSMTATSARPLAATGWSIIPFVDNPGTDPDHGWDSIQHKYTPIKPGIYMFEIRGYPIGIALLKNDPGTFSNAPISSDIIVSISTQTGGGWQQSSGISLMNGTTDYVRMWASNTSFPVTGANPCFTAAILP